MESSHSPEPPELPTSTSTLSLLLSQAESNGVDPATAAAAASIATIVCDAKMREVILPTAMDVIALVDSSDAVAQLSISLRTGRQQQQKQQKPPPQVRSDDLDAYQILFLKRMRSMLQFAGIKPHQSLAATKHVVALLGEEAMREDGRMKPRGAFKAARSASSLVSSASGEVLLPSMDSHAAADVGVGNHRGVSHTSGSGGAQAIAVEIPSDASFSECWMNWSLFRMLRWDELCAYVTCREKNKEKKRTPPCSAAPIKAPRNMNVLIVSTAHYNSVMERYLRASLRGECITLRPLHRWKAINTIYEHKKPIIVLCGGTSGCGKSTLANLVAARLGIETVISTDTIRQVLRPHVNREENPEFFVSSYEAHKVIRQDSIADEMRSVHRTLDSTSPTQTQSDERRTTLGEGEGAEEGKYVHGSNRTGTGASRDHIVSSHKMRLTKERKNMVVGFKRQCLGVLPTLDDLLYRYVARGESLVVEGVHLLSEYMIYKMQEMMDSYGVLCVPLIVYIENEKKHLERLSVRAKAMSLLPQRNKYVASLTTIRTIQQYLVTLAEGTDVLLVNNTNVDRSLMLIHHYILECLDDSSEEQQTQHLQQQRGSMAEVKSPPIKVTCEPQPQPQPQPSAQRKISPTTLQAECSSATFLQTSSSSTNHDSGSQPGSARRRLTIQERQGVTATKLCGCQLESDGNNSSCPLHDTVSDVNTSTPCDTRADAHALEVSVSRSNQEYLLHGKKLLNILQRRRERKQKLTTTRKVKDSSSTGASEPATNASSPQPQPQPHSLRQQQSPVSQPPLSHHPLQAASHQTPHEEMTRAQFLSLCSSAGEKRSAIGRDEHAVDAARTIHCAPQSQFGSPVKRHEPEKHRRVTFPRSRSAEVLTPQLIHVLEELPLGEPHMKRLFSPRPESIGGNGPRTVVDEFELPATIVHQNNDGYMSRTGSKTISELASQNHDGTSGSEPGNENPLAVDAGRQSPWHKSNNGSEGNGEEDRSDSTPNDTGCGAVTDGALVVSFSIAERNEMPAAAKRKGSRRGLRESTKTALSTFCEESQRKVEQYQKDLYRQGLSRSRSADGGGCQVDAAIPFGGPVRRAAAQHVTNHHHHNHRGTNRGQKDALKKTHPISSAKTTTYALPHTSANNHGSRRRSAHMHDGSDDGNDDDDDVDTDTESTNSVCDGDEEQDDDQSFLGS